MYASTFHDFYSCLQLVLSPDFVIVADVVMIVVEVNESMLIPNVISEPQRYNTLPYSKSFSPVHSLNGLIDMMSCLELRGRNHPSLCLWQQIW